MAGSVVTIVAFQSFQPFQKFQSFKSFQAFKTFNRYAPFNSPCFILPRDNAGEERGGGWNDWNGLNVWNSFYCGRYL